MRVLEYEGDQLVGYMGLDYRAVRVGDEIYKVLGVSDFCVESTLQRQGIGTTMLSQLSEYASTKDVDFIILVSDLDRFYVANGYVRLNSLSSWLRVHEHKNYGVAVEQVDDLYVKPTAEKFGLLVI